MGQRGAPIRLYYLNICKVFDHLSPENVRSRAETMLKTPTTDAKTDSVIEYTRKRIADDFLIIFFIEPEFSHGQFIGTRLRSTQQ